MSHNEIIEISQDDIHERSITSNGHNEVIETPQDDIHERSIKSKGTLYASLAIIEKMVGPVGAMALPWAFAQLGWVVGLIMITLVPLATWYVSTLFSECYCSENPNTGKRHTTYIDAVQSSLGEVKVKVCSLIWYCVNFGGTVGCIVGASKSMWEIIRSICLHRRSSRNPCHKSDNTFMIVFGAVEIILSQIPNFDQSPWLSIVRAVMSLTFSLVGIGLGIKKVATADTIKFHGNLFGISNVTQSQEIWGRFQALGFIAFIFSYLTNLPVIQDTIKSPTEAKSTMKKATLLGVGATTLFYRLYACVGYAAFGDSTPRNILTPFGFYKPYWLLDIANAAVAVHLAITYQLYCRPLFALVEKSVEEARFPGGQFFAQEITVPIPGFRPKLNLFRLIWRTIFVMVTTIISMLLPFFNYMVGILGALGFGPLAICFPIEMYITRTEIPKWSTEWVCLRILSLACLVISIVAAIGSIVGIVHELKGYKPFKTRY